MSKQDDIDFLNSLLRILQEDYETLQNLLPCDLLPDNGLPQTSHDDRCAQLAYKHGFDGNLFRNLFPLHPGRDGLDYELLIKRYRKQIETIPRVIAAIESADTIPPDKLSSHYSPKELVKAYKLSWDTLKKRFDSGQIRNVKHSTKDYQIHIDDLPSDNT